MHTAVQSVSSVSESGESVKLTPLQQIPSLVRAWRPIHSYRQNYVADFHFRSPHALLARQLFPTLMNWKEKTLVGKIMSIVNAPIVFVLAITVPVVEVVDSSENDAPAGLEDAASPGKLNSVAPELPASKRAAGAVAETSTGDELGETGVASAAAKDAPPDDDDDEIQAVWNRYMFTLQCFLIPLFVVFGLGFWNITLGESPFPVWALALIISVGLAALSWFTTKFDHPPVYNLVLASRRNYGGFGARGNLMMTRCHDAYGSGGCSSSPTLPLSCRSFGST